MSIKIIDNFANINEQLEIINYIKNNNNLLHKFDTTSVTNKRSITSNTINYPQIVYQIFSGNKIHDKNLFCFIYELLQKNNISSNFIHRIKINTTFPYPNNNIKKHGPIHTDLVNTDIKATSIIYYVNNSDGDTLFFDKKLKIKKKISPRQGKAIVFDSNIYHAGSCPINSPYRQVINFVLYK